MFLFLSFTLIMLPLAMEHLLPDYDYSPEMDEPEAYNQEGFDNCEETQRGAGKIEDGFPE
jgi:hypothetical protein